MYLLFYKAEPEKENSDLTESTCLNAYYVQGAGHWGSDYTQIWVRFWVPHSLCWFLWEYIAFVSLREEKQYVLYIDSTYYFA